LICNAFGVKIVSIAMLLAITLSGCQQKMAEQPSLRPDEPSDFFADGQASRPAVPGTVARGQLRTDLHFFTGKRTRSPAGSAQVAGAVTGALALAAARDEDYVRTFPFPVNRQVLEHGRDRYTIFCAVCHDAQGTGRGKIVERGYTRPPSYHIDRLRSAPVGYLFDVITNGYGSMPDYKQQVPPGDRWAIIAYIRALQLSQHFPESELDPAMRREWRDQEGERHE
jgi:mono/diheme cytochrome c family protein